MPLPDYSGPFDPSFSLSDLDRPALTRVARELMLGSHLQDRAGIPAVLSMASMDEANDVAIREWMSCSPVYTKRMQRLMGFEGTHMSTLLKGLQLDMGFPHQFLDVGYSLVDEHHAEFWLRSCGALADVRPMGHEMVKGMCHDIEDPTFDATAVATNPRARVRPIHRPPEVPAGGPDCHWTITISADHEPVQQHPLMSQVARSNLAMVPNDPPPSAEPGGWDDYHGPFDPHFELEDLSHRALALVAFEFAIQGHLLAFGYMAAVTETWGVETATDVGRKMWSGVGWTEADRLADVLEVDRSTASGVAKVLQVHHALLPRDYLGLAITMPSPSVARLSLVDSPALDDDHSLSALLDIGGQEILESICWGVNRRAIVTPDALAGDERAAWTVHIDQTAAPADEPQSVQIARFSTGTHVEFRRRRPLRLADPA